MSRQNKKYVGWAVAAGKGVFFGVAGLLFVYLIVSTSPALSQKVSAVTGGSIVSLCSNETNMGSCYNKYVPLLLYVAPVSGVFEVIREIQKRDEAYRFCHVLAHKLGITQVKGNPDRWMDYLHMNPPDGLCSNGYVHGVILGKFNDRELTTLEIEEIKPQLAEACEAAPGWDPSELDKAICYHGLGHTLTHLTQANLPLAADFCRSVALKEDGRDYVDTCIAGVFMQIFQPLEPEDYELIEKLSVKPTKDTFVSFCSSYGTEEERGACIREGWPLFEEELKNVKGVESFCNVAESEETRNSCFQTVFAIGARGSIGNIDKQLDFCADFPQNEGQICINLLASAVVEEDRTRGAVAGGVCVNSGERFSEGCFEHMVFRANHDFGKNAEQKKALCSALPDTWREKCLR